MDTEERNMEKQPQRLMRMIRLTWVGVSVCAVLLVVVAGALYYQSQTRPAGTSQMIATPTREEINYAAARLVASGRSSEVFAFYAMEVGDPLKAMFYVTGALQAGAPVDEYVSQGWWESGHQVGVVMGPNQNGSYDVSPAGLNTLTYKQYSVAELAAMEFNIPEGAAHLRRNWGDLSGKVNDDARWDVALVVYNSGRYDGLKAEQVRYVAKILRHEWELDRRFAARFPEAF